MNIVHFAFPRRRFKGIPIIIASAGSEPILASEINFHAKSQILSETISKNVDEKHSWLWDIVKELLRVV